MIPVIVCQHDWNVRYTFQRCADAHDTRAGVEDEPAAARLVRELHARRIAAISDGTPSGPRHRASHSPETHAHAPRAYYADFLFERILLSSSSCSCVNHRGGLM